MKIFLIGMMGSGKTSLGKKLANALSYSFVDVDEYIEKQEKKTVTTLFKDLGEESFRKLEHHYLKQLISSDNVVISTGGGLPCYYDNIEIINKNGISIYLEAEPAFLKSRLVLHKNKRPLIANIADADLEAFLSNLLQARQQFYKKALIHISAKSLNIYV